MKSEATWTAIAGGIVTILAAFGIITANEGTALTTSSAAAISGVVGLATTIAAIVKRHKAAKAEAEAGEDEDAI